MTQVTQAKGSQKRGVPMKEADKTTFTPWSPRDIARARPTQTGRSNSFTQPQRESEDTDLFGSMSKANSDVLKKQKTAKFQFLKKLKKKEKEIKQKDGVKIEIITEDVDSRDRRMNTELDRKASDPIHVNNLFRF